MNTPLATYRIQLGPGFDFDQAAGLADYLVELGISHLYVSPVLQAAPGSTHGYDVVDPSRISAELGGMGGFMAMAASLAGRDLGLVMDVVPNHMAVNAPENQWWWDVLARGCQSPFASFFDIDWGAVQHSSSSKLLVPVLADHYGRVLERGQLSVEFDPLLGWVLRYAGRIFPLAADSPEALADGIAAVAEDRDRLAAWINADADRLDALLECQYYRLAFWKVAAEELDYRRFFDIDSMAGVRVEDPEVFEATHALVVSLVKSGTVQGLRIDHIDGLAEPGAYLRRLHDASGGTWTVVEKILEGPESIPSDWPVAGTTGYEYLNLIAGLFVDADGLELLDRIYAELTGIAEDFDEIAHVAKHEIMAGSLATDLTRVVALFARVCAGHRRFRDYSHNELAQVTEEMIACMPVYRTYVGSNVAPSRRDVVLMDSVAAEARRRRGDLDVAPNTFLAQVLSGRSRFWRPRKAGESGLVGTDRPSLDSSKNEQEDLDRVESELRVRFSQVSVAIMAKAVEDTAFYRYHRLISANEVGGSPRHPVTTNQHFHDACRRVAGEHPATMVTTSTHDTKRGEDARARISLLSEIPDEWGEAVRRWMARNQDHRVDRCPDANAEYLMYQTIVGAWPIEADRLAAFMAKAAKEAKLHTSWTDPDLAYEAALEEFVGAVMADEGFLAEVERFVAPLVGAGRITALAQTALRLTVPGVPDTYQGSELWNHSLVDPDNRKAVDFDRRRVLIREIGLMTPAQLLERSDDAIPKLALTRAALRLRRAHPEWLGPGAAYEALSIGGAMARHAVALGRGGGVVVVVPRLVLSLERAGGWGDTVVEIPPGDWLDVVGTGRRLLEGGGPLAMSELLAEFPVALLARRSG